MKMLMFDFRESERDFFNKNDFDDFEIEFIKEPLNNETVLTDEQLNETVIISVFITSNITEEIIKKFKNLRIITTRSTGYNHIDLKYCIQNNIAVFNVGSYGSKSVAQYTFMLLMALVRRLIPAYLDMKNDTVQLYEYEGCNLECLTLGVVGGGAIGKAVCKIANSFSMKILLCSIEKDPELSEFTEYVSMGEIFEKSDIITLHIPANEETYHIINDEAFSKMKDGVLIINTARGELIDIKALYGNIVSGKVRGAALDVIECENIPVDEIMLKDKDEECKTNALIVQKLLNKDNVIITPHIAYNTKESIETILETTFNNIRDFLKGLHTNQLR